MSSSYKIFIDGQQGTTGLQIQARLRSHPQIRLLELPEAQRKCLKTRKHYIEQADIAVLCLPDAAARDIVTECTHINTRIIDASTAHRCHPDWVYGLPELDNVQRARIAKARYVANPGCYATGAVLLLKPLLASGLLSATAAVQLHGYSGYSGGGKAMMERYQQTPEALALYGLGFDHKHIPEIMAHTGLTHRPSFFPHVVNTQQGMVVTLALSSDAVSGALTALPELFEAHYSQGHYVRYRTWDAQADPFFLIRGLENTNFCDIYAFVSPDGEQAVLVAKLDNLGKGASGAAVQNMNIMLGLEEHLGLDGL